MSETTKKWLDAFGNERKKQVEKKSYDDENDDGLRDGSIADAAAHYASASNSELYPWDKKLDTKSKHTRKEQLIIAGALLLSELERIDRLDDLSKSEFDIVKSNTTTSFKMRVKFEDIEQNMDKVRIYTDEVILEMLKEDEVQELLKKGYYINDIYFDEKSKEYSVS